VRERECIETGNYSRKMKCLSCRCACVRESLRRGSGGEEKYEGFVEQVRVCEREWVCVRESGCV